MTLTMTAKGPEDLLAAVPIVLGFEPEASVVMLTFSGRERLHARVDMPPGRPEDESTVATLLQPALAHDVDKVAFVLYTADSRHARRLSRLLLERFGRAGVEVVDCLRADAGRWYAMGTERPRAPERGTPYDAEGHPFRAQAVLGGLVTLGSRAELEASIAVEPAAAALVEAALPAGRALTAAEVVDVVSRGLANGSAGSPHTVADLLLALRDPVRRDAAWNGMGREAAPLHVRLWSDVVRRAPQSHVADPAALLAFSAWLAGHGALGWCAVDRCLGADPGHRLGLLVSRALEHAVAPSVWEERRPGM